MQIHNHFFQVLLGLPMIPAVQANGGISLALLDQGPAGRCSSRAAAAVTGRAFPSPAPEQIPGRKSYRAHPAFPLSRCLEWRPKGSRDSGKLG